MQRNAQRSPPPPLPSPPPTSSSFHSYLIKARDACHWIGHLNDPPSPYNEFDEWLLANQSCGGGGGGAKTCPFVDVFLCMVLKARQAVAAAAVIMLGVIVIAVRSAQFVVGRASRPLRAACKTHDRTKLYAQAAALCALTAFVLLAVYRPAYHAFVMITGVAVWSAAALGVFVGFV